MPACCRDDPLHPAPLRSLFLLPCDHSTLRFPCDDSTFVSSVTILRFVSPAPSFSCPSFPELCGRALARCSHAGLFWLPPPLCHLSSISKWLSGCWTPNYVRLDCFRPARPSNVGRLMILKFRQSLAPSSMSKGTFLTGDTRKSAHHVDPPLLFLKNRVVCRDVAIGWPLKPINSTG
jgi:hypothetical protein